MKILHPNGIRVALVDLPTESIPTPEVALALLAGQLQARGVNIRVFDLGLAPAWDSSIRDSMRIFNPQLIGVTVGYSAFHDAYLEGLGLLRDCFPEAVIVIGGNHATNVAGPFLKAGVVDAVVRGEGELALGEIIDAITGEGDWEKIPGVLTARNSDAIKPSPARLITDLDRLAPPAFDLLPYDAYLAIELIAPTMLYRGSVSSWFIFERGCPYACEFCASASVFGKQPRYHSPARAVELIERQLSTFNLNHICFWDDIFTFDREAVIELCHRISQRCPELKWGCQTRVDRVDQELLEVMALAGCSFIEFGIENPDPEMSRRIGKNLDSRRITDALSWTSSLKISTQANYLVGYPWQDMEQLRSLADFGRSCFERFGALPCYWTLRALPGSKLWEFEESPEGLRRTSPARGGLGGAPSSDFAQYLRDAWRQDPLLARGWFERNQLLKAALSYRALSLDSYLAAVFHAQEIGDFVGSLFFTDGISRIRAIEQAGLVQ